jgi:endonuclease YncB( thermonuclease family)
MLTPLLIAAGLAGYVVLDHAGLSNRPPLVTVAPHTDAQAATFSHCEAGRRITCVVDGDTIWLSGEKIRIADIDAPELSPPRCETERVKGESAKRRLQELLNAGPFSLVAGHRDIDRYGRKLRMVTRQGQSIGDTLIEEGLAHRWGSRARWCG